MIQLPTGPGRDYLLTFGAAAIFVATSNGRPSIIAAARDPRRSLIAAERRFPGAWEPTCAFWLNNLTLATQIAERAWARLPAPAQLGERMARVDATGEEAERAIRKSAGHVALIEHESVMARARAHSARLKAALEDAKRDGQLQFFNRSYSAYRQQYGSAAMSYPMAERRLRRIILESFLKNTPDASVNSSMIRRIFSVSNEA
jgi:hypothetical protein